MFHKRAGPEQDGDSNAKKMRQDLQHLFLTNSESAGRMQSLFQNAEALAEAAGDRDIVLKKLSKKKLKKNLHRDYVRTLAKGSLWPSLYISEVRVWNHRRNCETTVLLPIVLPHELLHKLDKHALRRELLLNTMGLSEDAKQHLRDVCAKMNCDSVVPLGLWGDGVPCNYDRSQSLEVFAMSLPGLTGDLANMRFPLAAVNKRFVVTHSTFDDIMKILKWSLQCCLHGQMPNCRHDQSPFNTTDKRRKTFAG